MPEGRAVAPPGPSSTAPATLASAPDCGQPALIRLSPNAEAVASGKEQVFSFKKGSWSPPTAPKKTGRAPSYTQTSGPCHSSVTALLGCLPVLPPEGARSWV